jgi:hypothetical protein
VFVHVLAHADKANMQISALRCFVLCADEADEFVTLLGSRELAAAVDERLLVHLLLRADSINRKALHWRRLKVWNEY